MANSRVGQYLLEYTLEGFSAPVRSHKLRCNVMAQGSPAGGTLPTAVEILRKGGTTGNLQAIADEVWSYFRLAYSATVTASSFILWYWLTNNIKTFISTGTPASPSGATGSIGVARQAILTFRGAGGGIAKLSLLEPNLTGDNRVALVANAAGNPAQRIAAYAISANSPMMALDNSFLVAPNRDSRGENEAIWRMVYRAGN